MQTVPMPKAATAIGTVCADSAVDFFSAVTNTSSSKAPPCCARTSVVSSQAHPKARKAVNPALCITPPL